MMVNVRAEYPEDYKEIYIDPNIIHIMSQEKKENKEYPEEKLESEEIFMESCPNKQVEIVALASGAVVKIPALLAVLKVQINLESLIELSEPIFHIKEIKKKVNISQCILMQDTEALFIRGFIRKDISYYTKVNSGYTGAFGEVQTLTINIPFKCTTLVKYNIMEPDKTVKSTIKEFVCIKDKNILDEDISESVKIVYEDLVSINQETNEYYNEPIYCEIVSSKIIENESLIVNTEVINQEQRIHGIKCDGILYITIRILQNRLITIPAISSGQELTILPKLWEKLLSH